MPKVEDPDFRERAQQRLKDNSEYQKRSTMTREDRARDAKDRLTKNLTEFYKRQNSKNPSYEAERKAEEINRRYTREVEK